MDRIYKGIKSVYLIRCLPTKQSYIGSTTCSFSRWKGHMNALNIGRHENKSLQSLYNTYGKSAFVFGIIKAISDDSKLRDEEKRFIGLMQPELNVKYMTTGGETKATYSYRAKASIVRKAKRKCKKLGITISQLIETMLINDNEL